MSSFQIGQQLTFTAEFRAAPIAPATVGTLTDPAEIVFRWRTPAGIETSYTYGTDSEVQRASTGIYTFTAPTIARRGNHFCRAVSTAGLIAATETLASAIATHFAQP